MITKIFQYTKESGGYIFATYTKSHVSYKHGGRIHKFSSMTIDKSYLNTFKLEFIY
jgi:hypothetical protein